LVIPSPWAGTSSALDPREGEQVVGDVPEGDQPLLTGHVVGVALALDIGGDVGARAVVRLGQGEGDLQVTPDQRRDEALELIVVGVGQDRAPGAVGDVDDHPQRGVGAREQLDQFEVTRERQPASAK
jgi:hypothetical protein